MRKRFLSCAILAGAAALCAMSAPASAAVTLGWYNLQWPPTLETAVGTPTDNIYGQVWADGVTNAPGQGAGILAQVGFGPTSDAPGDPSWTWTNMVYNVDSGNNDEYMGNLVPTQVGTFAYATRFSGDDGANWLYADKGGPGYDLAEAGVLTVTPEPASMALSGVAAAMTLLSRRRR